jgi:outer membrane lipoprotein-sorting protein
MNRPIRSLALLAALLGSASADAAPRKAAPAPAPVEVLPPTLPAAEIVGRANAFLNGVSSLSTEFSQTGPDGRRVTGRMYLARPGRLRFDYDPPAALEVVSDGAKVTVRDRRLKTSQDYPASQTPLRFLLQDDIDLARDLKLTAAARTAQGTYVAFESDSTFAGTSKIALFFDDAVERLLQWRVIDATGGQTVVTLGPLDRTPIQDTRVFDPKFQSVR